MKKIMDHIYVLFFGKYTLDGFAHRPYSEKRHEYILDSVFPDEQVRKIALSYTTEATVSK